MIYIADILILAFNSQATLKVASEILELLQNLGFIINWENPSCLHYKSGDDNRHHLDGTKTSAGRSDIKSPKRVLNMTAITLSTLMRLTGKMTATILAVLEAPLHYSFH